MALPRPPVDPAEQETPSTIGRAASSVARVARRAKAWVSRGGRSTARPLQPSEVLFLELLQICLRRNWHVFAVELLTERARQHVQVAEALRASEPGAEDVADGEGCKDTRKQVLEIVCQVAVEARAKVSLFTSALLDDDSKLESVQQHSRVLLDSFAASVSEISAADRERLDRALEVRNRRFVVLGSPESDAGDKIDAEARSTGEDANSPLHLHALAGLSLSGGGIRSASFAIGAVQAMSRAALLPAFDYVSSVSGGGYTASWLVAWAYRHTHGIHGAEQELFRSSHSDSGPLRWVRRHSSYLAPRPGLTSSDAWALLVAYVSNWLPIFAMVTLALLTSLLLPHALSAAAQSLARTRLHWLQATATTATLLSLIAYMGLVRRLTLFYRIPGPVEREPKGLPQAVFLGALIVTVMMSISMPLLSELVQAHGWRAVGGWPFAADSLLEPHATIFLFWLGASICACLIAVALSTPFGQRLADGFRTDLLSWTLSPPGKLRWNGTPLPILGVSLVASSLLATFMIAALMPMVRSSMERPWLLIAFGPFILMFVFAVSELFGLMWTLNYQRDMDRAWAARVGAWMLACVAGWTLLCGFSLGVNAMWNEHGIGAAILLASVLSILLMIALISWRMAGRRGVLYMAVAGVLLVPMMYFGLAHLTTPGPDGRLDAAEVGRELGVSFLLTVLLATLTNVNRYSLHAIYKEGLVRTFLGASRKGPRNPHVAAPEGVDGDEAAQFEERRPDPVTNIDDGDNPSLAWLRTRPGRQLPILLLNAAVNGSSPTDVEGRVPRQWPFTFSQYFSGSPANGIGYAPTASFFADDGHQGVTLGEAMAVSGAAMSPTSGRTTHPVRAFILGMLNARLGIWIGNPHYPEAVRKPKPPLGGFTVLREMLGLRAKFGPWIHLSDGGHFENLGVYELLRRGCRRIVVIDASCDPGRKFADLANAIRRARIDLGIQVQRHGRWEIFGPDGRPSSDTKPGDPNTGWSDAGPAPTPDSKEALGKARAWTWFEINYGLDLPRGRLLYIKPSVYNDQILPVEVRHYWREAEAFPHESTADQFFTERQLEAYRALGELSTLDAMTVLKDKHVVAKGGSVDDADPPLLALVRRSL